MIDVNAGLRIRTELANASLCASRWQGSAAGRSLGLVHSSTSDTRRVSIELDANAIRATRLKKSVITGARLHDQEATKGSTRGAWYMLTTTYASGRRASPRDISELLKRVRGYFNRATGRRERFRGTRFRYLWVLELTKSLRPHYHVLLWVPKGIFIPHVDRAGWWPHGLTKFEKARNAVGYLAKYASKFCGAAAEALPKGFRTHAVGGLGEESKRELRWWKAPTEARTFLGTLADIRKALGGYVDKLSGVYWPSPWRVMFINGKTIAWRIESCPTS